MGIEIERKFLLRDVQFLNRQASHVICQGYLSLDPERIVRVRTFDELGVLTIKGKKTEHAGLEFEYAIPFSEAQELLALCIQPLLEKKRYHYQDEFNQCWDIDIFFGDNAGLALAEIELSSLDASVQMPSWVGLEVSDDPRYFNSYLQQYPFSTWGV